MTKPPIKPFDTYKWRWLSVQPSEGLLEAPVFLGVLRALSKFEGNQYSSEGLQVELNHVQIDTKTDLSLARDTKRNLFRNSGQYWRGTGLILPTRGRIELTQLGRMVSSGEISRDDFAALMVRNTVLPNPLTYKPEDMKKWEAHKLKIKPLELILEVITTLSQLYNQEQAYLTSDELIKIIIPLAGAKTSINDTCKAIYENRMGVLDITSWPNCVPEANDKRLAKEFLLFLKNFEVLTVSNQESANSEQKYILGDSIYEPTYTMANFKNIIEDTTLLGEEIDISRQSNIPDIIERTRVTTSVIRRQRQVGFRKDVFKISNNTCLLTNEIIPDVLEAAHIIPVSSGGSDIGENGLCLRVDIHRLYDSGKIRIFSDGKVWLNSQVSQSVSYKNLPEKIYIPKNTNKQNLIWREKYL